MQAQREGRVRTQRGAAVNQARTEGSGEAKHFDLGLLASRTVRKYISIVQAVQCVAVFQLVLISPETQRLKRTIIYALGPAGLCLANLGSAGWRALLQHLVAVGAFECKSLSLLVSVGLLYVLFIVLKPGPTGVYFS